MEVEAIKDVLSRTLIFHGLGDVQRALLAHVCNFKQYNAGVEIIKEGGARRLFIYYCTRQSECFFTSSNQA